LGWVALFQRLAWYGAPEAHRPIALAVLALGYGLIGYGLRYARRWGEAVPAWGRVWESPLARAGLALTGLALFAVGAAAPTPVRAPKAEGWLEGRMPDAPTRREAALRLQEDIAPIDDIRAPARYRRLAAAVLLDRLLEEASRG